MKLVKVDIISAEPFQAGIADLDNIPAGVPAVGSGAPGGVDFRYNDDVFAPGAQGLAQYFLSPAVGINLRRIEEIDSRIQGLADYIISFLLIDFSAFFIFTDTAKLPVPRQSSET